MDSTDHICQAAPDDGDAQGANKDCSREVPSSEVSGHGTADDRDSWQEFRYDTKLQEGCQYKVKGTFLNDLHRFSVDKFNEHTQAEPASTISKTYAQAYWNGYGAAISTIRFTVQHCKID